MSGSIDRKNGKDGERRRFALASVLLILIAACSFPLYQWQQTGEHRARSLSNLRRLADAWQLYAQDWDACPAPPVEHRPDGNWLTWPRRLNPYGATPVILDNPANPVSDLPAVPHDPQRGFPVETSYALNTRFWNTSHPARFLPTIWNCLRKRPCSWKPGRCPRPPCARHKTGTKAKALPCWNTAIRATALPVCFPTRLRTRVNWLSLPLMVTP